MKPLGKLASCRTDAGPAGLVCAAAGALVRPSPSAPASLPKCRRENLPSIDAPRGVCLVRHRAELWPGRLVWIDLIGGNPVDLEFDHDRRLTIDDADAAEIFRAHRQIHDHIHGVIETD